MPKKGNKKASTAAKLSPLLLSAFEVLTHGLYHFLRSSTAKDMKFALLHLDQAVELMLKERIRAGSISIYKSPKETITIWSAYNILEQQLHVAIPERPDLELLHEERNNIQHKYANPNPEHAAFHVAKAMAFVRRFVKDELKLNIEEYVPSEYLDQI